MKKKETILALVIAGLAVISGCGEREAEEENAALQTDTANGETTDGTTENSETASETTEDGETEAISSSDMFTDRDRETGYEEESAIRITLSGDQASCDSDAVEISGSTVTVTKEGTYLLSGTLDDGSIVVDAQDTDKIQLVLDDARITSSTSAAIYVKEADKVFLTTASGSENTLANGGEYVSVDDYNVDGAVFSKSDLTVNGEGTLTVTAAAGHGIVSKDDLVFAGGTYEITAAGQGISGKDSVRIADGMFTVTSEKDGIHSENTDDAGLGFVYIEDGTFTIDAAGDGISASGDLTIAAGDFSVTTGEGSASVTMSGDSMDFGPPTQGASEDSGVEEEETTSQKGIKAEGDMTIAGGSFVTDTADDSLHTGGDLLITGGEWELRSGDDAVHSDAAVTIQDGTFAIAYCYEGIEGLTVTIEQGYFTITSEDDGINAAGGTDSSGFGGGRPEPDQFSEGSDSFITISGGTFVIESKGDCIDSNGDLTIQGGTLDLTCQGNGNTALDCDGSYSNTGGDVTTNDGSEENPGQMGGGKGGMGGPARQGVPGGMERPGGSNI